MRKNPSPRNSVSWTRPVRAPRVVRPAVQPRNSVSLLFYSYPPAIISEWCGVTLHHAYRLKNGTSAPSRSVLKLFELHARGRVLGPEWKGWRVVADRLVDPDGGELTAARMHGYRSIIEYAAGLAREASPKLREEFFELMQQAG